MIPTRRPGQDAFTGGTLHPSISATPPSIANKIGRPVLLVAHPTTDSTKTLPSRFSI